MKQKAWVVSVEMGYGHMRAARPLRELAEGGEIIAADNYGGIPDRDRRIWVKSRNFYHSISRLKEKNFLGDLLFRFFDSFQKIEEVDRKQVKPTFQLKQGYALIKKGWGRHLIERLNEHPLPLITTFFTIGQMAEVWNYKGEIYVLATDSDVSRAWAPLEPAKSRINYFAPTETARKHLISYGVSPKRIHLTGFPLPPELVMKAPLFKPRKPLAVAFAVGGAGAQAKIGKAIVKGLAPLVEGGEVSLTIILGTHRQTKDEYFRRFNEVLAETDVLWTKPSELSFYAGLGLAVIIAPPLGAQEEKNREWLLELGAGIDQKNPAEAHKWLPELLESGELARAAESAFSKIGKNAVEKITRIISQ